ncbi:hypothetical protein GE061_003420 [Apolygus lucorum]|uniref:Uncharacterized protein n=1 Tax=Apolygus lucorum TaxID=248454 RepID=A0A6A4JPU2_APOLU|nr:hypothetical protein GE061_003420 [Apolygus lucorum]
MFSYLFIHCVLAHPFLSACSVLCVSVSFSIHFKLFAFETVSLFPAFPGPLNLKGLLYPSPKANYRCDKCNLNFGDMKRKLDYHKTHECGKDLRCPICSRKFTMVGNLRKHVAKLHNIDPGEILKYRKRELKNV